VTLPLWSPRCEISWAYLKQPTVKVHKTSETHKITILNFWINHVKNRMPMHKLYLEGPLGWELHTKISKMLFYVVLIYDAYMMHIWCIYDAFVWASSEKHMSSSSYCACRRMRSIAVQRKHGETKKENTRKLDVLCSDVYLYYYRLFISMWFLDKEFECILNAQYSNIHLDVVHVIV
jgi:hypothetical protein